MTPRTATELDSVYRKIFQRLVPFLMSLWVLAWIERIPFRKPPIGGAALAH